MIAATPTPTDPGLRRPRKDPTRISAQEHMILIRMKRIDRGQGCHAAVDPQNQIQQFSEVMANSVRF